ncbi:9124_t:CDS:1, partial [Funneliformis caledonium]
YIPHHYILSHNINQQDVRLLYYHNEVFYQFLLVVNEVEDNI